MRVIVSVLAAILLVQSPAPPRDLPASAAAQLAASLAVSRGYRHHIWRDTAPLDALGRLVAFVEIAQGDRRKFEFDMKANAVRIDRTLPRGLEYPVNYGFVPQTVSYDGDPFDVLVLGPPIDSGTLVHGVIVGIMHMTDEKGPDSKAVISPVTAGGRARFPLTAADRRRIGDFFDRYKRDEPGKFSRVHGWGSVAEARQWVQRTHGFFVRGGGRARR